MANYGIRDAPQESASRPAQAPAADHDETYLQPLVQIDYLFTFTLRTDGKRRDRHADEDVCPRDPQGEPL